MSNSEVQAAGQATGGGKGKRILLMVLGAIVLMTAGGALSWFFLPAGSKAGGAVAPKAAAKSPPTFVTLEPFVVNLAGEAEHYLQVGIDLKLANERVKDQIKVHLPEIRNGVLLLLSSKQVGELATLEGKNRLRAEIREAVNRPLGIQTPAPRADAVPSEAPGGGPAGEQPAVGHSEPQQQGVLEVLLSSFVIQ